ncbi:MAG: bifunctional phosphopantothenoylcysteine decarboxylase/phosphopantothenate--cysteine ligase CoaBC [Flavobacteriales bacterium]|tara:strand:- start:9225 stop:10427 length:1203 start_codon:yes stop_codon:yes gene_type:complete
MSVLNGQNVLLGISASIAAYKSAELVRCFVKLGANVRVVQTPSSKEFVTPLTLSTLSKNPVLSTLTKEEDKDVWNNHVEIGLWADIFVIAPASSNTLSKMSSGECDNLLLTTYMSAKCPVFFAPAMDLDMYKHPSTITNIEKLISYGNFLIPPGDGELASGLVGKGRMAEPHEIVSFIIDQLYSNLPLSGKKVLLTAGPTYEAIDPVRFIGNHSSGKMGVALANKLAAMGAMVDLVIGPSNMQTDHPNINRVDVVSSVQMLEACDAVYQKMDIAISSAAVADYKPKSVASSKIKKKDNNLNIDLEPTVDILKHLGDNKKNQILIGFALETDNEEENAKSKIAKKNLDFIVLNSLNDKGAGFKHDTNKISIIDKHNKIQRFELKSKDEVANDIVTHLIKIL